MLFKAMLLFLLLGNSSSSNLCVTKACIEASYRILKEMNQSADPCQNFYEFSCGNFNKETIIPDELTKWTAFEPIEDVIYKRARLILEAEPSTDDFKSYQLARDHYKACTDEEKLETIGLKPIFEKLEEFGGWPVLLGGLWNKNGNFSVWKWTYKLNQEGFNSDSLIELSVVPDDTNTTWRILQLDEADLGMSREYLIKGFDDRDVQSYFKYMVDSAVLLGANRDIAKKELKDSLLFEIELAEITTPREDRRNSSLLYNPTTIGAIEKTEGLPSSWIEYFHNMMTIGNVTVNETEKVNIANPKYLKQLGDLLNKTAQRTVANYLGWRLVKPVLIYLNDEARQIRQQYRRAIYGAKEQLATWKRCVEEVGFNTFESSNLIYVADSMYVKNFFNMKAKKEIEEMTQYLRRSFKDHILKKIDWMDDKVKERAKLKLTNMEAFIAFSDEYLDSEKIDALHQGLEISSKDFFGNTLRLAKFWRKFEYNRLHEQINILSWIEHYYIALVNALYYGENNYMEFPAGILQGVFYAPEIPKYVNFGGIGVVIGHEITHGFDDEGKQRNEVGEIDNWWDSETEASYKEKAECMIEQYSNYFAEQVGMHLDGVNNIGENIADNGGIKESYHAYNLWVEEHGEEDQLPGLNYTPQQVFWISFAQLWCSKYRDEALKEVILTDYHSPGEFRVIGTVSNSKDFARDFNCPLGSNMNPVHKCAVW